MRSPMSSDDSPAKAGQTETTAQRGVPSGYRQGIISAILVVLGFSLVFLRFWGFELKGAWDATSVASAAVIGISVIGQLVTLWRSLQLEDDTPAEYRKTLRWFLGSTIVLIVGIALSSLAFFR